MTAQTGVILLDVLIPILVTVLLIALAVLAWLTAVPDEAPTDHIPEDLPFLQALNPHREGTTR